MTNTGIVEVTCISCNRRHIIIVPVAGYKLWASKQAHIQDALPGLTLDERELLISNLCRRCYPC